MVEEKTREIQNYTDQLEETKQLCHRYSKTCLKQPLKIDKTKILMTNGSFMKVQSIAECSKWSIFGQEIISISLALSQKNEIEKWHL